MKGDKTHLHTGILQTFLSRHYYTTEIILNPKKGSGLASLQFQPTFLENIC